MNERLKITNQTPNGGSPWRVCVWPDDGVNVNIKCFLLPQKADL